MKSKIVIAGSRSVPQIFLWYARIDKLLVNLSQYEKEIISGGARGADTVGEMYAKERGYKLTVIKPEWDKYGKKAGFIRNKQMIDYACTEGALPLLIAIWDGKSKGTQHTINLAKQANIDYRIIPHPL